MPCHHEIEDWYRKEKVWGHTQFKEIRESWTWKISHYSSYMWQYDPWHSITSPKIWNGRDHIVFTVVLNIIDRCLDVQLSLDPECYLRLLPLVTCEISIIDSSGAKMETKKLTHRTPTSAECRGFISRSALLLDATNSLLPNDELTLHCELVAVETLEKSWKTGPRRTRVSESSRALKTVASHFGLLLKNGQFSDVELEVGESKIPAHKLVLMARSPVFAAMFQLDMLENQTNTVVIQDIEEPVFREMLNYLYTNDCDLPSAEFALKLLVVADRYDIPSLKAKCADYCNDNLSEMSVLDAVVSADAVGESKLREICLDFVCPKLSGLMVVDGDWRTKLRSSPGVMADILRRRATYEIHPGNTQFNGSTEAKATSVHTRFASGSMMWKISGCRLLAAMELGKFFRSPEFGIAGEEIKCHLEIHPNGELEEDRDAVIVRLYCDRCPEEEQIYFSISEIADDGKLVSSFSDHKSFGEIDFCYCFRYDRESVVNHLPDMLMMSCDIRVIKRCAETPSGSVDRTPKNALTQDLGLLHDQGDFSDVLLDLQGAQLPAHSLVLKSRSNVFASMLEQNQTERSLSVTGTTVGVFRKLLRHLYTDEGAPDSVDDALDMLDAALQYDVPSLQADCVEYLHFYMSELNVVKMAIAAFSRKLADLYKDCVDYICRELPSVALLDWPIKELYDHPDILQDLLERTAFDCFIESDPSRPSRYTSRPA